MNKKEQILKASLKLFVELGEQGTSMKLVAERANCGMGTVYNYFLSKDELISNIYIQIKTQMADYILKDWNEKMPIKEQFAQTVIRLIEYGEQNPEEYKFLDIFCHSNKVCLQVREKVALLFQTIFNIYETGKSQGIIKDIATEYLMAFVNGAIVASTVNPEKLTDKCRQSIAEMAWDAIKTN